MTKVACLKILCAICISTKIGSSSRFWFLLFSYYVTQTENIVLFKLNSKCLDFNIQVNLAAKCTSKAYGMWVLSHQWFTFPYYLLETNLKRGDI